MRNFHLVSRGHDVTLLHNALMRKKYLWNAEEFRTSYTESPSTDVDDIVLRHVSRETIKIGPLEAQNDSNVIWWPAAKELPEAKSLVMPLMSYLGAYELMRLFVSRLAPGKTILPHEDNIGEYVNIKDIARYHIVIQGMPGSMFKSGDEEVCMQTGEVWWFDPKQMHSVVNNSADDRVHLVVDFRVW